MDQTPLASRDHSFSHLSQEDEDEEEEIRSQYVNQELVDKIRSKINCCLVDWFIRCFCAKSKWIKWGSEVENLCQLELTLKF